MSLIYYRKPHDTTIYRNRCTDEPEELHSLAQLNGRSGFVIVPFAVTEDCPILLLQADFEAVTDNEVTTHTHSRNNATNGGTLCEDKGRDEYAEDFRRFHRALSEGKFAKLVLARSTTVSICSTTDNSCTTDDNCTTDSSTPAATALDLFHKACSRYPRMFIALISTQRSGTWLIATPETLLSGTASAMSTMALAGTMRLNEADRSFDTLQTTVGQQDIRWSSKNIREQRFVETYLTERIATFAAQYAVNGPYTVRAGDLVHLRSDITFSPRTTDSLGDILDILHPTPAVCGIPKEEATRFIQANEHGDRSYYSGFSGIISPQGDTFLYVTLRCMNVMGNDHYRLYAGGGLLVESEEEKEWAETEAKMATMKNLL